MRWVRYLFDDKIKYGIVNDDRSISEVDTDPFAASVPTGAKRLLEEVTLLGDVVEIEISGIGTLRNRVVAESGIGAA
jgi:hypothetical protein